MDNLNIHKSHRVRQLIEGVGCRVWFLPTYSPDLNPIEKAWSKLKEYLRRVGARTREALEQAIGQGLDTITAQDAAHWFDVKDKT
jgi:transposase